MKSLGEFLKSTLIGGLLIILPIGLALVLGMKFISMLRPMTEPVMPFLPESFRFPALIAVLMFLFLSFGAGLLALTAIGQSVGQFIEDSVLYRIPGYSTVRSLTRRIGDVEDTRKFAPAFVELEGTLVLAFIIETHDDGRYTVFVPSVPTPAAGSIYIMDRSRVHLIDAPFMDAVRCVSKFGVGSAELLKSMRQPI